MNHVIASFVNSVKVLTCIWFISKYFPELFFFTFASASRSQTIKLIASNFLQTPATHSEFCHHYYESGIIIICKGFTYCRCHVTTGSQNYLHLVRLVSNHSVATCNLCPSIVLLVTLYGRYRGKAAWQWCLPAPARLSRWHIPQSLWTGCPLRKTIRTEKNWAKSRLTLVSDVQLSHWILQNHLFNLCYQNTGHHLCQD